MYFVHLCIEYRVEISKADVSAFDSSELGIGPIGCGVTEKGPIRNSKATVRTTQKFKVNITTVIRKGLHLDQ